MDKELIREVDESESYYRVTINGKFGDFKTIPEALEYIEKVWKDSHYCSIRHVKFWSKNG